MTHLTKTQVFDGRHLFISFVTTTANTGSALPLAGLTFSTTANLKRAKDGIFGEGYGETLCLENCEVQAIGENDYLLLNGRVVAKIAPAPMFDLREDLKAAGFAGVAKNLTDLQTAVRRPYGNSEQIRKVFNRALESALAKIGKTMADYPGLTTK